MPLVPTSLLASLHSSVLATATTTAKKSSGGNYSILILIVIFLGVYMLWIRPQRNKMRQTQAQQRQADIGDEVVTTGGIVGRIRSFENDRVTLEVAPGTTIEIVRAAIGRRIDPPGYDEVHGIDENDTRPPDSDGHPGDNDMPGPGEDPS